MNGVIREEIPNSSYDEANKAVIIVFPADSYRYEVVSTEEGLYSLTVTSVAEEETLTFAAVDIPTSANAIHDYIINWEALSQGEKGVTLRIDSDGDGTFEQIITTGATLQPPVADANGPYTGIEGQPTVFDGSKSYDPEGMPLTYKWDFGDDTTGIEVNPSHIYAQDGIYTVTLIVNDGLQDGQVQFFL